MDALLRTWMVALVLLPIGCAKSVGDDPGDVDGSPTAIEPQTEKEPPRPLTTSERKEVCRNMELINEQFNDEALLAWGKGDRVKANELFRQAARARSDAKKLGCAWATAW